jgi:hypothetical protein
MGAYKFRRTSNNTAFHDAHSKWNPCEIVPRRSPFYSRRAGWKRAPMRLGIAECLRAPVLGKSPHKTGIVLQDPRATKTEGVRFQAAFAAQPGRNGLLDVARKNAEEKQQTCTNTARGYER